MVNLYSQPPYLTAFDGIVFPPCQNSNAIEQQPNAKKGKIRRIAKKAVHWIEEATVGFSEKLLTTLRSVVAVAKEFFHHSAFFLKSVEATRFFIFTALPFTCYNLYKGCRDLILGPKNEKIDAGLMLASEVGSLGDCAVAFATGLEILGQFKTNASWVIPLAAVSTALSVAAIIAQVKGWWESRLFLKNVLKNNDMHERENFSFDHYKKIFEDINSQENKVLQQQFKVSGNKLKKKIHSLWTDANKQLVSTNESEKTQAKAQLKQTIKLLKDRVETKKRSHTLAIIAAVVGLIATVILLCTPLAPLALATAGYTLLALSSVVSIGKIGHDIFYRRHFIKKMGFT